MLYCSIMNDKEKFYFSPHLITAFLVISITLTGFLTYHEMLYYFFTSPDTFHFIMANRVESFSDIIRIIKEPLAPGALAFYRPVLRLSYSLDNFLWGLDPFGYHLTQLILHISVSISVFFLMLGLKCSKFIAWLGAIIFITHPMTIFSIPEITRSHDVLSVFFILFSLIFMIKHLDYHKKIYLFLSLLFYILALGSKEIAVITPAVILAYLMIIHFSDEKILIKRLVPSLIKCIPYFAVTILFLILRSHIISGVIRYHNAFGKSLSTLQMIKIQIKIAISYFTDLVYPISYLDILSVKGLLFTIVIFFLSLLVLHKKREININDPERFLISKGMIRMLLFLLFFLLLPLAIFVLSVTFAERYMYLPLIPFSALLSFITVKSIESLFKKMKERPSAETAMHFLSMSKLVAGALLSAGLTLSLFAYSPLIRGYSEYEYIGNLSKVMFEKVTDVLPKMQDDTIIKIYNLPGRVTYHGDIPPKKLILCLDPPTLKQWLDLNYPDNKYQVVIQNTELFHLYMSDLDSEIQIEITIDTLNNVINVIFPTS